MNIKCQVPGCDGLLFATEISNVVVCKKCGVYHYVTKSIHITTPEEGVAIEKARTTVRQKTLELSGQKVVAAFKEWADPEKYFGQKLPEVERPTKKLI